MLQAPSRCCTYRKNAKHFKLGQAIASRRLSEKRGGAEAWGPYVNGMVETRRRQGWDEREREVLVLEEEGNWGRSAKARGRGARGKGPKGGGEKVRARKAERRRRHQRRLEGWGGGREAKFIHSFKSTEKLLFTKRQHSVALGYST